MKIKVLQTIRQGQIGGGERHVIDLVEGLDKSVFHPVVLSFTDGEMIKHLNRAGIESHVIYTEKAFDRSVWPKVSEWAKAQNFDLIHAHGTRACSNSYKTAQALKLPILYTVHGWSFHPGQNFVIKNLRQYFESFLVKHVDKTILVSEENQRVGQNLLGLKNSLVVKNGVDLKRFDPSNTDQGLRIELGIPADVVLIGFIARITLQKDPLTLIKAFGILSKQHPNARLLVVGGGDLEPAVRELVKELNLQSVVFLEAFRTDVPRVLKAMDVFCLPSLWEGLPIGVLEAMAMGKPVVATPVGGTPELVEEGVNGYLVPEKNPIELAKKLSLLVNDAQKRTAFGLASRNKIEKDYTVARTVEEVSKVYQSLVKKA